MLEWPIFDYSKFSKILNSFLLLFANKMLAIRARIHKMLVRIANKEDQIRLLPCVCVVCLCACAVCLGLLDNATSVRDFRTSSIEAEAGSIF